MIQVPTVYTYLARLNCPQSSHTWLDSSAHSLQLPDWTQVPTVYTYLARLKCPLSTLSWLDSSAHSLHFPG